MLIKYGVNPTISFRVTRHFDLFDSVFMRFAKRECIITSANDGLHSKGSIHYKLKGASGALRKESGAVDFRTKDLTREVKKQIFNELKARIEGEFDIVSEKTHIHCEYDPK